MDGQEIVAGVEEQVIAEPDVTIDTEVETTEESAPETKEEDTSSRTEEDSRFASVRRKAEEDAKARYESEKKNIDAEFKRMFGTYTNPTTGKAIEGYQDYLDAINEQNRLAREEEFKSKGIDPKIIDEMINNSPAVRQANEIMRQNQINEANRQLADDIKTLGEIDPEIKSLEDLQKHPSFNLVSELVRKNHLNVVDAYKLANYESLADKKTAAVKQAAINQVKSKNHLDKTSGVTTTEKDLMPIPTKQLDKWKQSYPGLSLEQLTEKYNSIL